MALQQFLGDLIHPIHFSKVNIIDDNHRMSATACPRMDLHGCSDSTLARSKERACRWGSLSRQSSDSSVMMAPQRNWSVKTTDSSSTSSQSNHNGPERVREKVFSDSALSLPSRNLSPKSSWCQKGGESKSHSNQSWSPTDQKATMSATASQSDRLTADILNNALHLIADGSTSSDPTIISIATPRRKVNLRLNPEGKLSPSFYSIKQCSGRGGTRHLASLKSSLQVSRSFRDCFSSSSPVRLAKESKHWDHSEEPNYSTAPVATLTTMPSCS
jgi:hypothetical protein